MKKMRAHATKGWEIRCIIINVQEHDDAIPRRFQDSDVAENTMREYLEVRHLSNDRDPDVIELEDQSLVPSVIHRAEVKLSIELVDVEACRLTALVTEDRKVLSRKDGSGEASLVCANVGRYV